MQDFSKLQSQFETKLIPALYIVATPIGNLLDISLRALTVLQKADYIVCEDSRVSAKLLHHYEIKDKKFIIYNDHANQRTREKILNYIIQGNMIALISDAGTPLISDPGYKLVKYVRQYDQKVIPIPGASSVISALCASGIACDSFLFSGFLPTTLVQKENLLRQLPYDVTSIFFDSATRLLSSLQVIATLYPSRNVAIAKELTKLHEDIIVGKPQELLEHFDHNSQKLRGEFVIIIEKADKKEEVIDEKGLLKAIEKSLKAGQTIKELSKNLSEIYHINKKDIYQLALKHHK